MDLIDEIDQNDSGMESLTTSKDETPERKPEENIVATLSSQPDSRPVDYDDEPDETLKERLWGLTEMFPECVRNATYIVTTSAWSGTKGLYGLSRTVMWIVGSSSVILFAPVIFEVERAQMDEMQKSQQKQVLLGPNAALAGSLPSMPPVQR